MTSKLIIRIAGAILLIVLIYAATRLEINIRLIIGIVLSLLSLILLITSRVQLGKSFSVKPEAKELIKSGIYSKIEHPLYFFLDLLLAGIIIITGIPYLLIIWVLLAIAHLIVTRKEENVLSKAFGTDYHTYRKSTWF